jgi:hypothetical protein
MAFEKGNKLSKGRPTKVEEEKTNYYILTAIKEIKSVTPIHLPLLLKSSIILLFIF